MAFWLVAVALGCRSQSSSPAPAPAAGTSAAPETAAPLSPVPTDPLAVLAAAPELTPESARMLLETAPGASVDVVARTSLLEATYGFSRLRPDQLRDLGAIFATAYAHLTVEDRGRLESYLQRVRAGDPGTGAEEARARRAFNMAIKALTPADRQRLQALYARAIAASLDAKKESARRAAEPPQIAVAEPSAPATPPADASRPAPMPVAGSSGASRLSASASRETAPSRSGRGEAYWRNRAQQFRATVARLEREVSVLDAEATRLAYGADRQQSLPGANAAQANATSMLNAASQMRWQEERTRVMGHLDRARRALAAAKQELDGLDDEARRDGALPGWLR